MNDEELYAEEAEARWANTEEYKQSIERVKKMSKEDLDAIKTRGDELMQKIALVSDRDPKDTEVQELISEHYNNLRSFYEPNLKLYRGLAEMFVSDPRFTSYFEKYKPGLATFMRDAMMVYCDNN